MEEVEGSGGGASRWRGAGWACIVAGVDRKLGGCQMERRASPLGDGDWVQLRRGGGGLEREREREVPPHESHALKGCR